MRVKQNLLRGGELVALAELAIGMVLGQAAEIVGRRSEG